MLVYMQHTVDAADMRRFLTCSTRTGFTLASGGYVYVTDHFVCLDYLLKGEKIVVPIETIRALHKVYRTARSQRGATFRANATYWVY
jgi:hypothetical protein